MITTVARVLARAVALLFVALCAALAVLWVWSRNVGWVFTWQAEWSVSTHKLSACSGSGIVAVDFDRLAVQDDPGGSRERVRDYYYGEPDIVSRVSETVRHDLRRGPMFKWDWYHDVSFTESTQRLRVHAPYWFLMLLTSPAPAWWLLRVRRQVVRRRRAAAGRCKACGYDLRGSPGRCPECGAPATDEAPKKMSCMDGAAAVLKAEGKPMQTKAMVEAMAAKGLWTTNAPTPAATLYSAILRELKKGAASRFKKTGPGHFGLNAAANTDGGANA